LNKGIECEGYVLRWSGVASRGKLAGKRIPVLESEEQPVSQSLESKTSMPKPTFTGVDMTDIPMDASALQTWSPSLFDAAGMLEMEWHASGDGTDLDFDTAAEDSDENIQNLVFSNQGTEPTTNVLLNALDHLNIPLELKFILNYRKQPGCFVARRTWLIVCRLERSGAQTLR
jgi:hypothetical protein